MSVPVPDLMKLRLPPIKPLKELAAELLTVKLDILPPELNTKPVPVRLGTSCEKLFKSNEPSIIKAELIGIALLTPLVNTPFVIVVGPEYVFVPDRVRKPVSILVKALKLVKFPEISLEKPPLEMVNAFPLPFTLPKILTSPFASTVVLAALTNTSLFIVTFDAKSEPVKL